MCASLRSGGKPKENGRARSQPKREPSENVRSWREGARPRARSEVCERARRVVAAEGSFFFVLLRRSATHDRSGFMETLEASRVCRLCGNKSGISINIFDEKESHVRKINAVLPIMVHEMDLLPKHMCHRCSYKLEEFHKFYVDCLKTDAHLKSQLSWMRKDDESEEKIGIPMVHIENVKIKVEPVDYDAYDLDPIVENVDYINAMSSMTFPVNTGRTNGIREEIAYTTYCRCYCDKKNQRDRSILNEYQTTNVSNDDTRKDNETRNIADSLNSVKRNLFDRLAEESKPNVNAAELTRDNKTSANRHVESNILSDPLTSRILRPRKNSVDYVGTKKKSYHAARSRNKDTKMAAVRTSSSTSGTNMAMATATIKIEKEEKSVGRELRPRKGTIDYIGRKKRKLSENHRKNRTFGDKDKRRKLEEKIFVSTKVEIKQEVYDDLEDMAIDNSEDARTRRSVKNLNVLHVDAISPCKVIYKPNTAVPKSTTRVELKNNLHLSKKLKSLSRIRKDNGKSKLSKTKIAKRVPPASRPLKYLRSHSFYLRSGKVKKFADVGVAPTINGMRRNVARQRVDSRNSTEKIKRNLLNVINGTLSSTKVSASVKLFGTNVKHYCERCNISFVNKELFKLHSCYD